ncbi:MAG: hypothetical protein ACT4R6_05520 [Gemmatimonadaceae bacterium]
MIGVLTLSACLEEPTGAQASVAHSSHAATLTARQLHDVEDVLKAVKRLTVPYRRLSTAKDAGYSAELTKCMESPLGGMGFHYGSLPLIDGNVEPLRPEILMYEPRRNGDMELVGVEYVVPYTAWTKPEPPSLAGIAFHKNDTFQLWVLHAWIWKHNPTGVLQDWNPRVTCKYAPEN